MQKHFLKFGKVFTNIASSPLILISNNSELAAKYLPNDVDQSIKTLQIPNINNVFFQGIDIKKEEIDKFLMQKVSGENFNRFIVITDTKKGPDLVWVRVGVSDLVNVEIKDGQINIQQ